MMQVAKLLATVQEARNKIEARKSVGIKTVKPPQGESRWRILPGWRENEREIFYHEFGLHWIKDENNKVVAVYVCERDTFGRPCPIDDALGVAIRAARAAGHTRESPLMEALQNMSSRRSVLVNALPVKVAGLDPSVPVLFEMPGGVFDDFIALFHARLGEDLNLLDLQEGRDIIITREGTNKTNTRYKLTDAFKSTTVDPSVLDKLVNIDAFIAAQKESGDAKGIGPLNEAIARITGAAPAMAARAASLVPAGGAAALAPPSRTLEGEAPVPVAPAPSPGAAKGGDNPAFNAPVSDKELDSLLAELA